MGPALLMRRWGQGPPVLLYTAWGPPPWERPGEASSGYAGVAPDLLGFSHSPTPPDVPYDVTCHLEVASRDYHLAVRRPDAVAAALHELVG